MAPPIGVIIRNDDAILTSLRGMPEIVMANMVGNMIASKA